MADRSGDELAKVFGGGGGGAAPGGPSGDELGELAGDLGELPAEDEEADAPPPDFAMHAVEAFPNMEPPQIDAFYRAIKACHPVV